MALQNRVLPDGTIVSETWRGQFMGNRGGRIHEPSTKQLLSKRWASKRWIICRLEFKQRRREVMGNSYTELFFLDEVSALAAGHRPCFECRRSAARKFASCWKIADNLPATADAMDEVLHHQRLNLTPMLNALEIDELPDGAIVGLNKQYFSKRDTKWLRWTSSGFLPAEDPPRQAELVTPEAIVAVLRAGYGPVWHDQLLR